MSAAAVDPIDVRLGKLIGFRVVETADDDEPDPRCVTAQPHRRLEQLPVALFPHESPDGSAHDVVRADAPLGAQFGAPLRGHAVRSEPFEIHAVSEHGQLAGRDSERPQGRDVLGVLHQLRVGCHGRDPFQEVHDRTLRQWVLGGCVQTVDRVDDARHAGRPRRQAPVDPRLGIVGVHDVGFQGGEQPPQLEQRARGRGAGPWIESHGPAGRDGRRAPRPRRHIDPGPTPRRPRSRRRRTH